MASEIQTSNEFEFDGFWWEPAEDGEEPQRAQGTLHYTPDEGAVLSVVDWHPNRDLLEGPHRIPVIHGIDLAEVPVSLFDALERGSTGYGVDGHSRERWHANQLIFRAHVDDPEQFEVERVRVRYRGLREWLGHPWHGLGQGHRGLGLDPGFVEIELEGAKLTLSFSQRRHRELFEEHFEVTAAALFELDRPMVLPDFKERYSGPLHDFIVLAAHEESRIESMTVLVSEDIERWWGPEEERRIERDREIEIVERTQMQPLSPRKNPYQRMLMPWAIWGQDAAEPIRRWFELRRELAGAGDALFATLNVRFVYLENQFLNLTGFAEAYHRTLHDDPVVEEEKHEELVEAMLGVLDEKNLREHYGRRLQYAGEQFHGQRLRALIARAEPALDEVGQWRKRLVRPIVLTRNYLTHWSEWTEEVLEGRDRWLAVVRLRIVIEINLMLDLGMDPELAGACARAVYWDHPALTTEP